MVDQGFQWPCRAGRPLDFVAQIACSDIPWWSQDQGFLLFFYDNEHWGLDATEKGYIQVLWQKGEREFEQSRLPSSETKQFLGLRKKVYTPKVYKRVPLQFVESKSFPSEERLSFVLPGEAEVENYCDFLDELNSPIQVGGYPFPIQNDNMEQECAEATGIPAEYWTLLLQTGEVGDQVWGDAGILYWFIPKQDLDSWNFERCWMICQCH